MSDTFTVYTEHGAVVEENISLARAAELADVQEEDLMWCIENTGYCWNQMWVAPFGDPCPQIEGRIPRW